MAFSLSIIPCELRFRYQDGKPDTSIVPYRSYPLRISFSVQEMREGKTIWGSYLPSSGQPYQLVSSRPIPVFVPFPRQIQILQFLSRVGHDGYSFLSMALHH